MLVQRTSSAVLRQHSIMYILILVVYLSVFSLSATCESTVPSPAPAVHSLLPKTTSLSSCTATINCARRVARRRMKRADTAAPAATPARQPVHTPIEPSTPEAPHAVTSQKTHSNVATLSDSTETTTSSSVHVASQKSIVPHNAVNGTVSKNAKTQSKTEQQRQPMHEQSMNATTVSTNTTTTTTTTFTNTTNNESEAGAVSSQETPSAVEPKFIILVFAAAIGGIIACSCCILGVVRLMRRYYGSPASSAPTCSYSEKANAATGKSGKNRLRITSLKNIGAPMIATSETSSGPLLTEFWDVPSSTSSKPFKSRSSKKVSLEPGPLPKSMSILRDRHRSDRSRPSWALSCISKVSMITDFDAPPVPPLPCAKPSGSSPIGDSSIQQPYEKQKLRVNVVPRSQGSAEQHERGESPTSPALSNASTSYSASLYSSAKYKRKLENTHVPVPKINNTDSCSISSAAPSIAPSTTSSATCVHTIPKSHTAKNLPSPDEAAMAKASWLSEDEDNKAEPLKKKTTPLYDQNSRDVASSNAWDSESSQYQSANNEYSPRDKRYYPGHENRREQAPTRPRRESPDRPVRGEHTRQALNHQPLQHYPTESNSRQYHRHQQDMHYHTPRDQSYHSSQAPATHQYQHQHQHQHQYRPPRLQSREHLDHH